MSLKCSQKMLFLHSILWDQCSTEHTGKCCYVKTSLGSTYLRDSFCLFVPHFQDLEPITVYQGNAKPFEIITNIMLTKPGQSSLLDCQQ